jgi:hypothetical protein
MALLARGAAYPNKDGPMCIRTIKGFQGQCPLLFPLKQKEKDLESNKKMDALTRDSLY